MSKLAHSNQETMDKIEDDRQREQGYVRCPMCSGDGTCPWEGRQDPTCSVCGGEGRLAIPRNRKL